MIKWFKKIYWLIFQFIFPRRKWKRDREYWKGYLYMFEEGLVEGKNKKITQDEIKRIKSLIKYYDAKYMIHGSD